MRKLILIAGALMVIYGCADYRTQKEKLRDKETAHLVGGIGSLIGVPEPIGEAGAGLILAALGHWFGHSQGQRKERKSRQNNSQIELHPQVAVTKTDRHV